MSDFDKFRKEQINPTGKKTVRRTWDSPEKKTLSQYVNPTFTAGNEGEEVHSLDPVIHKQERERANEVESLKEKYKLPQGLREQLITNDNLDTPEKREGVIRDRFVINKDKSLIPKNLIDEINYNEVFADEKLSYSALENMTNDDFKKFIDGKREKQRLYNIDTASENAKKLVDYVKSGLKSKEDAGNRIKAGEEYLKGLEKMTKETGEPMPNLLEQGVIKGFIPKEFIDNPVLFGGASGPEKFKNMSDIEKVEFAKERKGYLDSLVEKYKGKGYDKADIDYLLTKQQMSGEQDVTKIESYIDQSLAEGKKEDPTIGNYVVDFGGALVQSVSSSLKTLVGLQMDHVSVPGFIDDINGVTDPKERMMFQWAKQLDSMVEGWKDPKVKQTFGRDLSQGIGSMVSFMLPGKLASLVGLSQKFVTMALGALMNGGDEYDRILTETKGDQTKATIGLLVNAGLGLTEAIPIERMFKGLSGLTGRNVMKLLAKRGTAGFLEEGIQEFGQQLGQGITAKLLDTSNQTGAEILGDSLYAGLLGGIIGTGMNSLAISGKYGISALKTRSINKQLSAKEISDIKDLVDIYQNIELQFPKLTLNDQQKVKAALEKKNVGFSINEKADDEGNPISFLKINDRDRLASILMKEVDENAELDDPRKKAIKESLLKNVDKITTESIDKDVEEQQKMEARLRVKERHESEYPNGMTEEDLDKNHKLEISNEYDKIKKGEVKKETKPIPVAKVIGKEQEGKEIIKEDKAKKPKEEKAKKEEVSDGTKDLLDLLGDPETESAKLEEAKKILNTEEGTFDPDQVKTPKAENIRQQIKEKEKELEGETDKQARFTITNELNDLQKELNDEQDAAFDEEVNKLNTKAGYTPKVMKAKMPELNKKSIKQTVKDFYSGEYGDLRDEYQEHTATIQNEIDDLEKQLKAVKGKDSKAQKEKLQNQIAAREINLSKLESSFLAEHEKTTKFISDKIKEKAKELNVELTGDDIQNIHDNVNEYLFNEGREATWNEPISKVIDDAIQMNLEDQTKETSPEVESKKKEDKEVYEYTSDEYLNDVQSNYEHKISEKVAKNIKKYHKEKVEQALAEGKTVSEEVLKDYPKLKNAQKSPEEKEKKKDKKSKEKDTPEPMSYNSTQVNIPDNEKKAFLDFVNSIPKDELYVDEDGSKGAETEPHVTALYGLHSMNPESVKEVVEGTGEVELTFGKTKIFEQDDYDVLVVEVSSPEMSAINKKLRDNLAFTNKYDKYEPHTTIAYLKKGEGKKYAGDTRFEGKKVKVSELLFSDINRQKTPISLSKKSKKLTDFVSPPKKKSNKKIEKSNKSDVPESSRKTVDFPIADLNQDVKRFQQRETEYSEETVNKIVAKYNPQKMEDIFIWKDTKNGKVYNLSGHSRVEALKRLKIKTIPARFFVGTEKEAINFAKNSNNQTPETVVARANYYRDQRASGVSEKEILKEAGLNEAKNSNLIIALSFLNPKGRTFSALKMLSQSSDKTKDNITTIARWIGTARQEFTSLTNQHENEMFDFLMDEKNNKLIRSRDQWLDRIGNVVNNLNFKADEPLNLKSAIVKSPTDIAREKRIEELTNEKRQILKKIKERKDLMESKGKIPEEIKKDKKILELQKVAQIIEQDIIDAKNVRSGGDIDMFAEPKPEKKKKLTDYVKEEKKTDEDLSNKKLENSNKFDKKIEVADKEIDDLWNEFNDIIINKKDGPKAAGINLDDKLITVGSKIVSAYINKGIYKLESILYEAFQKFGEKQFRDMFAFIKGAYTNYIILNDDPEIEKLMTEIKVVKNMKPDEVISGQVETPQELTEEEKQNFWKEDTEESLQQFLDKNDLNVQLPEEFISDLQRDGFVFLKKNTASLMMKYIQMMNKTRTPGTINTDEVRKLFKEAGYDYYNANDFHEPASELTKIIFDYFLWKYKSKTGNIIDMLFMIGSPGSGKTSSIAAMLGDKFNDYPLVFDGVLADFKSLMKKLKKAHNNYYRPHIAYVYCPSLKAFKQSLDRMQHELRPVPLDMFLKTYDVFPATLRKIHELDGMFGYTLIDNSGGKGEGKFFGIEDISKFDYYYNRKDFLDLIQNYYNNGKINEHQLEGILTGHPVEIAEIRNGKKGQESKGTPKSLDESAGNDGSGEGKDKTGESESKQGRSNGTKEDSSREGKSEKPKGEVEDAKAQSDRLLNGKGNRNDLPGSSEKLPSENVQGNDGSGLPGSGENSTSGRTGTETDNNGKRNSGDVSTDASLGTEQGEDSDRSGSIGGTGRLKRDYDSTPGTKNIVLTDDLVLDKTFNPIKKAADNIAAIRLLRQLTEENRLANPEEQQILARYVGWGGIPNLFDEQKADWKGMRDELKSLISEEDYKSARASVLSSFYTHPGMIRPMWNALKHLGFKGGRILDPSMGTGHFFGFMPQDVSAKSILYGVELDNTTGQIAKHLYPKAKIEVKGYEETNYPNDYFDLVISNIPFGNFSVFDDSIEPELRKSIHNYFFAKALDQVRVGGVVAFLTSSYVLDTKDSKVRQYLNEHANFVGSVRLPQGAFSKNANTEVVTDIIFLQKRSPRDHSVMNKFVSRTEKLINGKKYFINEYYDKNPGMVLGEWSEKSDQYNKGEKIKTVVYKGENLETDLDKAIKETIPEKIFKSKSEKDKVPLIKEYLSTENNYEAKWDGEFFIEGNDIYRKMNNGVIKIDFLENEKDVIRRDKMMRQIEINELARAILQYQTISMDDSLFQDDMKKLNERYDEYVSKYGFLNTKENMNVLYTHDYGHDPNVPYIMSLENWDDEKETATKGDRFTIRTAFPEKTEFKIESISDAINVSNNLKGGLDMDNIAKLYDQTLEQTIRDAVDDDLIYFDGKKWQDKDDYLSGNVVGKLNDAKHLLEETNDRQYERNISALEKVQPRRVPFEEIILNPGTNVIPIEDYKSFIKNTFNLTDQQIADLKIRYNAFTSRWSMDLTQKVMSGISNIEVNETYGVAGADGLEILQNLLNSKPTKVRINTLDERGQRVSVIDTKNTALAGDKAETLKEKFRSYFNDNAKLRKKIEEHFNNNFNVIANKNYDGQHLTLPGLNNSIRERLFKHVKDAVYRIIKDRDVMLAHCVGAGKTWSMSIGAMELRRLGLAKKPAHVVKNHMLGQYTKEFLMLYPNAKLLVLYPESITPQNRSMFLARISNGDWDSVIIPQTVFERLRVSVDEERSYINEEIELLQAAFDDAVQDDVDNGARRPSRTVKSMEKQLANLRSRLTAISSAKSQKEIGIAFEETGIDHLFVDEAHGYKNLYFPTKLMLKGLSNTHAQKSQDMFMKIRAMRKKYGKCITFATGTPVSNTMAELFTMQRYLQPQVLEELGLRRFDDWVNVFGSISSDYEIDAYGRLQQVTRLRRFENVPEIMKIFREVTDIKTKDDLKLNVPLLKNGQRENVESMSNEHIVRYTAYLLKRFEDVISGKVDPKQDNPLTITNDGKKASLDLRLVGVHQDLPDSKINNAVRLISKNYKETQDNLGTQLVFMDYGVPKKAVDNRKNIAARKNAILYINDINPEDINKELLRFEKILSKNKPTTLPDKLDNKGNYARYMIQFLEGLPQKDAQLRKQYVDKYLLSLDDSITFLTIDQEETRVDLFQDMKDKLVKKGIPADEIAFSSDPTTTKQRQKLYEDVNAGKIRVLIGTTAKLSEGVNIQKRLVALYHMNPTWKPSEMEQREGRILRSGNENKVVNIYNMIQERSFDVMNYSMLKNKQIMFAQVMSKDISIRSVEDMDDRSYEFGEVAAVCSGDPRLLERMKLEKEVTLLNQKKSAFEQQQQRIQSEVKDLPKLIDDYTKRLERVQKIKPDAIPEKFKIEINGKTFEDVDLTEEEKQKAADNRKIIVSTNKTLEDGIKITKEENAAYEKANKELEEYEKKRDQGSARIRAMEEVKNLIPKAVEKLNLDIIEKNKESGITVDLDKSSLAETTESNTVIGSYLNFDVVLTVHSNYSKNYENIAYLHLYPKNDPEYQSALKNPDYSVRGDKSIYLTYRIYNPNLVIKSMMYLNQLDNTRGQTLTQLKTSLGKLGELEERYKNKVDEYEKKQESYKDFQSSEFPKDAELREKESRLHQLDTELSVGTANNTHTPPPVDETEDPIDKIDDPENDENDDDDPPIQAQRDIKRKLNPQIYSKEFKNWFGDWENDPDNASQVTDVKEINGKFEIVPQVVYHGTDNNVNFDKFYKGSYFSESPVDAGDYAGQEKIYDEPKSRIYPAYLNIRNPLDLTNEEITNETWEGTEEIEVVNALTEMNGDQFLSFLPEEFGDYEPNFAILPLYNHIEDKKFIKFAKKLGYDGITVMERGFVNYMVFNPNQIKSAISNEGTFDPGDDRIQKQINAFHGSGAEFDKFSSDYIGTGEGMQAFGYGLYFTSEEDIAKEYAKKLAEYGIEDLLVNGKELSEKEILNINKNPRLKRALISILYGLSKNGEIRELQIDLAEVQKYPENYGNRKDLSPKKITAAIKYLEDNKFSAKQNKRHVYNVALHKGKESHEYTYLDWKEPIQDNVLKRINDQLKKSGYEFLQFSNDWKAVEKLAEEKVNQYIDDFLDERGINEDEFDREASINDEYSKFEVEAVDELDYVDSGKDLYKKLSKVIWNMEGDRALTWDQQTMDKEASAMLLEAGIDGIRYPSNSLGLSNYENDGYNYVVFDDSVIDVEQHYQFQKGKAEVNNYITALAKKINKVFPDTKLNFVTSKEFLEILKKTKEGKEYQTSADVPLGMVYRGEVYINTDKARLDTPIHEFGHIWDNWAEKYNNELWKQGIRLVAKETALINWIKKEYPNLTGKWIYKEALAHVIGVNGANIVSQTRIGNKTLKEVFQVWLKKLWDSVRKAFGKDITNVAALNPETMTLKEFTEAIAKDLLGDNVISRDTVSNKKVSKQQGKNQINPQSRIDEMRNYIRQALPLEKFKDNNNLQNLIKAFSGVTKDAILKIGDIKLLLSHGNSEYGIFHVIDAHYMYGDRGWIYEKELLLIPQIRKLNDWEYLRNKDGSMSQDKLRYKLKKGNITYYLVVRNQDGASGMESMTSFYSDRKVKPTYKKESPTTRHNVSNFRTQKSSFDDNNNISKSSDKSNISFQKVNDKTKEFYSPLEKIIQATKQEKYTSKDFLNWLKNQKGYKPAEFEWIGLEDFLSDKRSVTKQELLDYVAANKVVISDVTLDNKTSNDWIEVIKGKKWTLAVRNYKRKIKIVKTGELNYVVEYPSKFVRVFNTLQEAKDSVVQAYKNNTKYEKYILEGENDNYREVLITMPIKETYMTLVKRIDYLLQKQEERLISELEKLELYDKLREQNSPKYKDEVAKYKKKDYLKGIAEIESKTFKSFHFMDVPNIVAHLRLSDRKDASGKKILFVEEVQSDWNIAGREKGFKKRNSNFQSQSDMPPAMPFKNSKWVELTIKKAIQIATAEGYDGIAFVNGEQTAERYNLSQKVESINWTHNKTDLKGNPTDTKTVRINVKEGQVIKLAIMGNGKIFSAAIIFEGKRLDEVVGKNIADKIMQSDNGELKNDDLKIGGTWAFNLYDKQIPAILKEFAKKFGGQVTEYPIVSKKTANYNIEVDKKRNANRDESYKVVSKDGKVIANNLDMNKAILILANTINENSDPQQQLGLAITPDLQEKIGIEGMPMFQKDTGSKGNPQIYTKEFKDWFGDSKMLDYNGNPIVAFHGTDSKFTEFRNDVGRRHDAGYYGNGYYFTFQKNPSWQKYALGEAGYYGSKIVPVYLKIENPFDISKLSNYEGTNIRTIGNQTYVFLLNIAKEFPELSDKIKIKKGTYANANDNFRTMEDVPIKVIPELIEKYKKLLTIKTINEGENDEYKTGFIDREEVEYTNSKGEIKRYKPTEWLGRYNPIRYMDKNNKDFEKYPPEKEIEIGLVIDAIEKYEGLTADLHPEGYMTRYPEITDAIKSKGYDGILQSMEGDEAVVFSPNQIKSAVGNSGEFDSDEPDIMLQKDSKKTGKKTDKKNTERSGKSSEKSGTQRTGKEEFENPDAQSPEEEAKSFEDNAKENSSDPGDPGVTSKAAQIVASLLQSTTNPNNTHIAGDPQFDSQFKPRDRSLWGQRKKLQELAELLKNKFIYLQKIKSDPNIDKRGKADIIYGIDQLREEITNLLRNKINLIIHNVFGHFTGDVSTKVMNVGKYANAKRLEAIYNNPEMAEQQENLGYDQSRVAKIVANLEAKLSQEEKTAYSKLRIILDHYGKMLVKAGLIEEAQDQYFPFRVLEYINDFGIMGTGAKRVQKIIPGSSKKMKGTGEHYDIDAVSIIMEHLTQNERAIAFNKFEENILKKFDDQTKYDKETKKIEPGYQEYYFDPRRNFFKVKGLADKVLENLIGTGTIQDQDLLDSLRDYLSVGGKKGHRYIIPIGLGETIGDLHESVIAKTIPIAGALTRFWKKQMVSRLGLFTIFFHSRNMRTDNLKTFVNHPEAYTYLPQIDKFLSKKMNLAQRGFINLVDVTGGTKILKTGARVTSVKHTFTEQELNQFWDEGISAGTFSGQMSTEALSVSEREMKTLFTSPGLKKSFRELKDKLYVTKLLDNFDDVSRMRETKLRFDLYAYLRAVKRLSPAEAHLEVGKTMINYNHFTPTEKRWFINFLYPFYSWRKGNIETTIQQLRTGNSKQRARLISAMILSGLIPAIYNYIWYPDDEEKLQNDQTKRYISESFHLATPYFDENGNRIYIYDNNFVDDITSMLGVSDAMSETRKMMLGQHSIPEGLGHLAWNTTKGTYDKLLDETNPFLKLAYEYRANRNTFYGFPIYKEDDSEFNKVLKSFTYGSGIMSRNLSTLRNLIVGPASMTMKTMRLSGLPVTGVDLTRSKTNFDEMNKSLLKERLQEIKDLEKDRDKAKENALKTRTPEDVKVYQELNKQLIIMRKTSPDYKEYLKQNRLNNVEIQKLLKQNIP